MPEIKKKRMENRLIARPNKNGADAPAWDIARLFPPQGNWTEDDYLGLERACGDSLRVELVDGRVEVLPMPTEIHQFIISFMLKMIEAFAVKHSPGKVSFSGLRLRLSKKGKRARYRQPDVLFLKAENYHLRHSEYWEGADLVMEVVSGDAKDRERDYVTKVREYAAAGIPEYWIIDPEEGLVRVLTLSGRTYKVHGDFRTGAVASSVLPAGFKVAVDAIMAAGEGE